MAFPLSDIFIGNFPITQTFGVNKASYLKFGLQGHNGVDFGCTTGTQVVSAADGWIKEVGFDGGGYGNYVKIIHQGYLTLYGHLQQAVVHVGDRVIAGQLIGLSDNTGNSSGPHLHFGVAPCDGNGIKTLVSNGFAGYIDPLGNQCVWMLRNYLAPVKPSPPVASPGTGGDEIRALTVLYQAIQSLRTDDGQPFGNLEGLTRALVANYSTHTPTVPGGLVQKVGG